MTICISVKVAEGLVLAADSMVSLEGTINIRGQSQKGIIQTFEYANKVTQLKDYPIGVMSWGLGSIQDRSIQSLIMEFEYDYPKMESVDTYSVREVAQKLVDFISNWYSATYPSTSVGRKPTLGLFIGGYSHLKFFAEQFKYEFPRSSILEVERPDKPDGKPDFGANWFGLTDALKRLIKGFDEPALEELVKRGADKAIVQKWIDDAVPELLLVFDGMPLQDAIDFAEYAIQVTIGRWRFGPGAPLCGGEIDIAVIRPNSFAWAKRKQWGIR